MIVAKDTVDKVVQEELVDEINEEQKSVEKLVEDVSELISPENVEHKDVYTRQEVPFSLRNKEKDDCDQETIAYRNKGNNIIVLMDSNRRFMDIEASFVNKKVRTIPCGSVQKAKSIIDNPRFQKIDAILIHTGTNDLEDSSLDSQTIASNLLQVTDNATRKFPSAEVFLSEIIPRRDELNLKGIEVNSILANAAQSASFKLIKHANLARESLFFYRKHLNKFQGVPVLRKNICNSFSKVFPNLIINEITQAQRPFNRSTYISHKAYDHSFPARYSDLPRVAQHKIYEDRISSSSAEANRGRQPNQASRTVPAQSGIFDLRQLHSYADVSRANYLNQVPVDLPISQQSYAKAVTQQNSGSHTSCRQDLMSEVLKQLSQITTTMNTF